MNLPTQQQTMTSLQIAEIAGKQHRNVLASIRKMEEAWNKVTGLKFQLSEYTDSTGRVLPCYNLTKEECLYIATKFNDEARARLVLRWMELEQNQPMMMPQGELMQVCALQAECLELQRKVNDSDRQLDDIIEQFNAALAIMPIQATTTEIAELFGMTASQVNKRLESVGVIRRSNGSVYLAEEYARSGIATDYSYGEEGKNYLRWNSIGQVFLYLMIRHQFNVSKVWGMFGNGMNILKRHI